MGRSPLNGIKPYNVSYIIKKEKKGGRGAEPSELNKTIASHTLLNFFMSIHVLVYITWNVANKSQKQ